MKELKVRQNQLLILFHDFPSCADEDAGDKKEICSRRLIFEARKPY